MIKQTVRKIVPSEVRDPIRGYFFKSSLKRQIENTRKTFGKCIIFIATPMHGNLGDQAIVYAQELFFRNRGLGGHIVEIPSPFYERYSSDIKEFITKDDLIVIDGGGSMGTLWIEVEHKMQNILQTFPENPIVIFPQTIYYSKDSYGEAELKRSAKVYSAHKNLHICARERASYEFMKANYPNTKVLFIPDIVLSLNKIQGEQSRNGVVLCLRADKEKVLTDAQIEMINKEIKRRDLLVSHESTVIPGDVTRKTRITKLQEKWDKFSSAQLVITDRLHGMIFAAITGTPCIAFDNSSKKVSGVYNWIKDKDYIQLVENKDSIITYMDDLLNCEKSEYDNKELMPHYNELFDVIERIF